MIHLHAYKQYMPEKEKWRDFDHFIESVGLPPTKKHILIDGIWTAPEPKQPRYKRKRCYKDITVLHNVRQLAKESGQPYQRIYQRLLKGWSVEEACNTAPIAGKQKKTASE